VHPEEQLRRHVLHPHRVPRHARVQRRGLPEHHPAGGTAGPLQRPQQLGSRDRRTLLALRRPHLDPRVHVRVFDLAPASRGKAVMAAHVASAEHIAQEERRYIQVFIWLAVLTALEIALTYTPLTRWVIGTGLVLLAASKASMVALYYMHLAHEKPTLKYIALTPAILCVFLVLMLLPDLGAITRLVVTAIEGGGAPAH